jgi:hypothetical protein
MTNTEHLLERVRVRIGKSSKYALAKALEMTPSQLNDILKGKHGLGSKAVVRVAELTGIPTHDVLVLVNEDKAKSPEDKEFWSRRSPRITASLAIAALAFGLAGKWQDAQAGQLTSLNLTRYRLCVVSL